jgi:hypothetical protein
MFFFLLFLRHLSLLYIGVPANFLYIVQLSTFSCVYSCNSYVYMFTFFSIKIVLLGCGKPVKFVIEK